MGGYTVSFHYATSVTKSTSVLHGTLTDTDKFFIVSTSPTSTVCSHLHRVTGHVELTGEGPVTTVDGTVGVGVGVPPLPLLLLHAHVYMVT